MALPRRDALCRVLFDCHSGLDPESSPNGAGQRRPYPKNIILKAIGALQAALGVEKSPKDGHRKTGRWAWGRLVEALARHHLRHIIEVDEQMTVEIGETAIEVKIEG